MQYPDREQYVRIGDRLPFDNTLPTTGTTTDTTTTEPETSPEPTTTEPDTTGGGEQPPAGG